MNVLIACECSGHTREAFRALGHNAWSCDLLLSEDNSQFHLQCDVRSILDGGWDLMIAHPDCTYLTNSAAWAFTDGPYHQKVKPGTLVGQARRDAREEALAFVQLLLGAPIPRIAVENQVGAISSRIRPADQYIHPWQFGHDASKKTGLWLKNLPPLEFNIAQVVSPRGWGKVMCAADMVECIGPTEDDTITRFHEGVLFGTRLDPAPAMRWANQTDSGQNKLTPGDDRWKERARTYQGWSDAMAAQWGCL